MDLELMKCPMCGAKVNQSKGESVAVCPACGNEYFIESSKKIGDIDEAIALRLKNLRKIQREAVAANDISSTAKASYDILEIVAGDGLSQYYYAYAENVLGHNTYIKHYYNSSEIQLTPKDTIRVLNHIYEYSDMRDRIQIEHYIMSLSNVDNRAELNLYKAKYATRRAREENYDDIPRDVFICHRSTNKDVAVNVVRALESDSNSCWISMRNLRPNDSMNYWDNITNAIKSCSLFLVISSEDAMMSKDVKSEINIAKSLGKQRLEYKIDNSTHTSLFNSFFDGKMWVDGVGNTREQQANLCNRVFRDIEKLGYQETNKSREYQGDKKQESMPKNGSLEAKIEHVVNNVVNSVVGVGNTIATSVKQSLEEVKSSKYNNRKSRSTRAREEKKIIEEYERKIIKKMQAKRKRKKVFISIATFSVIIAITAMIISIVAV